MSLPLRPEVQALVRIRPVVEWFAHSFVPGPGCGLCARFYQAEPAPVVGTTKCPESLCLMLALPPSERRVPPLPRTLLLVHRSYGLMRQSRVALPYFGFWPRSRSLRRLLPAPAATGIIPTLSLQICHRMPGPLPRRSHRVHLPVSSSVSSAFPRHSLGRLPVGIRERDFSAGYFSRLQTFLYVQASDFARLPGRSYRCEYFRRAAEAFTSGLIVLRCLRTHRTCYPSEYRQLTEKGLPPF